MKKGLGKKLLRIKIGAVAGTVIFVACSALLLLDFGSSLAITDFMAGNDRRNPTPISPTEEEKLIEMIEDETLDDEYLSNMYFTKDNFKLMLEAIQETKESYPKRETDIYYQYYTETWTKTIKTVNEYGDESNPTMVTGSHLEETWEWKEDTPWDDMIHLSAEEIEQDREINPFGLYWQPIYALCQMQSLDIYDDEFKGWHDDQDDDGKLLVQQRLDMEVVQAAINVFNMQFTYLWDGAADKAPVTSVVTDISKVEEGTELIPTGEIDAFTGENIYMAKYSGRSEYKWTPRDGSGRNGGGSFENMCYLVDTYEENVPASGGEACYEHPDGSRGGNAARVGGDVKMFWEYQPPEQDEWNGYKRVYKKIPTTVMGQAFNGYSSHKWYTDDNTIKVNKFHYKYSDYCEMGGGITEWSENKQVKHEKDFIDVEKFYQACKSVCSSFDWEEFLLILETLPDTDALIDQYTEMYEAWKEAHEEAEEAGLEEVTGGVKLSRTLDIDDEEFKIGNNVIIGSQLKLKQFSMDGNYMLPGYGNFDEDAALNASLAESDELSYEQFYSLVTSYPGILSHSDSVLFLDPEGVAQALYDIQENYNVSAIGLFSIACLESGWGTSRICKEKGNFVGWQAYDNTPYSSSKDFGTKDYAGGLYQCMELIAKNYILKGQDTYYKMRYSETGRHNYCTSTTWPHSNSLIRAQMEKFLGIERFSLDNGFVAGEIGDRDFLNPLAGSGYRISSTFGYRDRPTEGASTNHRGIDMAASRGTPIYSVASGVVASAGYHPQMGYYVIIAHGQWVDGLPTFTKYMHMAEMPYVKADDVVSMGHLIGTVGSTGVSTGPHLHLTVTVGSQSNDDAVDPQALFGF